MNEPRSASGVVVTNRYALAPFQVWVGVLALYAGASRFLPLPTSGTSEIVGAVFPRLIDVWSVLYATGGLLILVGMGRRSLRVELAGVNLLLGGVLVSLFAFLAAGASIIPALVAQGGFAAACIARIWFVRKILRRLA